MVRHTDDDLRHAATRVLERIDPVAAAKAWGSADAPGAVPQDLGPLWDDLATGDPLRADLAVWRLAGGGKRTVELVRERLRPPTILPAKKIKRLIDDLDNDDFQTRERASGELLDGVESAADALRRVLQGDPPLEVRSRVETLLVAMDSGNAPEQQRCARAVRLLEAMAIGGSVEARLELRRLADGDSRLALTREAETALGLLE
jgi:hypothetical protein